MATRSIRQSTIRRAGRSRVRLSAAARRAHDAAHGAAHGGGGALVMVLLVVAVLAIPLVVGVRDWRCFALVLLWPPVVSAIQTANVSIPLALAAALVWRYRERTVVPGLALGLALAAKIFLWPLAVWLAVERRLAAVVWAAVSSRRSRARLLGRHRLRRLRLTTPGSCAGSATSWTTRLQRCTRCSRTGGALDCRARHLDRGRA